MNKKKSAIDAFIARPDAEKERQNRQYEKEFVFETGRPLSTETRARWNRAKKRGRGRPRVGNGAKVISLTVEQGLLKRTDARAKKFGVSRAALVAQALEMLLAG